jgi:hypothetical protein
MLQWSNGCLCREHTRTVSGRSKRNNYRGLERIVPHMEFVDRGEAVRRQRSFLVSTLRDLL